jgi:hypothetical protein
MTVLFILLYNLCIIGGTAYLVAVHNWSAWWFLLAALFLVNYSKSSK